MRATSLFDFLGLFLLLFAINFFKPILFLFEIVTGAARNGSQVVIRLLTHKYRMDVQRWIQIYEMDWMAGVASRCSCDDRRLVYLRTIKEPHVAWK